MTRVEVSFFQVLIYQLAFEVYRVIRTTFSNKVKGVTDQVTVRN